MKIPPSKARIFYENIKDEIIAQKDNNQFYKVAIERCMAETGISFMVCKKKFYDVKEKILNEAGIESKKRFIKVPKKGEVKANDLVKFDREKDKIKGEYNLIKRMYEHLKSEHSELESRFSTLLGIKEDYSSIKIIEKGVNGSKNNATPIILLSDWHFEETVDDATINYLNKYNLKIAEQRWFTCIQNSLRLVQLDRSHSEINNLVLWLGGDFITGYIHDELIENNGLSPTQASRFAKQRLISAIDFYVQYGKFDKIQIVCNFGNHGRTDVKKKISTGYKNSYEWMIYHDIADYYSNNKSISFTIPDGYFAYIKIYDFMCRFWHGDTIKYGGGIGGITVPLIKAIHRYNQQIKADYNFMGHYHQLFQACKDCIVNGSGIGFNAYAQFIGASPEDPLQCYCLIDEKRGMTIKAPIFCT